MNELDYMLSGFNTGLNSEHWTVELPLPCIDLFKRFNEAWLHGYQHGLDLRKKRSLYTIEASRIEEPELLERAG
jgi:hypothetical protein